ncbi:MAG TPA: methyltransferase domain-containing protein, partial [Polyangia bacterium]
MATASTSTPSRAEALAAAWRAYFLAEHQPAHPAARDAMNRDLVGALGRLIPPDATVLEAGCGRGDLLAALPQRDKAGFDSLPEIAAAARALHPDLRIFEDDATAPPNASGELADAVVCDRLVHSVLDIRALLLNLKARLKPGGRLYLTAFSYFWEIPARLAELAGWKRPAP